MIVAAECENNAGYFPDDLLGILEPASAIILDADPLNNVGFSRFLFKYHEESLHSYTTYCNTSNVKPYLHIRKDNNLEELYLACILPAVQELLQMEGLDLSGIDKVFPPQISSGFIVRLSDLLHLPPDMFIDAVGEGPDLFTSSLPYALDFAYKKELVKPGDTGLMITVGSGIQVGCAIYHF
ncbi:MAG: amino acid adenylation protein [Ferruginibacter sp.]|uniref:3-oxoacyl-[acyl-carrier-protein] synthase III C-terminal domain-containing protein n=1 Tax=Ferruginibacter sp. TaxID=1940288 RepID=UPI002659BCEC|nr:3-oxoacyl-[acyl-carrier-protein] synthase III C-terminal domain-containing protein [Ferruginibacter sp.]MDB5279086.1 amino acid adenylation protein [Ferruginibacter sp.]